MLGDDAGTCSWSHLVSFLGAPGSWAVPLGASRGRAAEAPPGADCAGAGAGLTRGAVSSFWGYCSRVTNSSSRGARGAGGCRSNGRRAAEERTGRTGEAEPALASSVVTLPRAGREGTASDTWPVRLKKTVTGKGRGPQAVSLCPRALPSPTPAREAACAPGPRGR